SLCSQRRRRAAGCSEDGYLAANQIGRQLGQSIVLAERPAIFDRYVAAFDIPALAQPLAERAQKVRPPVRRSAAKEANDWHCPPLRARVQRPSDGRTCNANDEVTPPHFSPRASPSS